MSFQQEHYLNKDITKITNVQSAFLPTQQDRKSLEAFNQHFPINIHGPKTLRLQKSTMVQLVALYDITNSKLAQYEELEMAVEHPNRVSVDRLKRSRTGGNGNGNNEADDLQNANYVRRDIDLNEDGDHGSNVINNIHHNFSPANPATPQSLFAYSSTCKLVLQDQAGVQVYAIEMSKLPFITKNLQLGCKMILLPNTKSIRGVLLLKRENIQFLGGSIKEWNIALTEKMMKYLKEELQNEKPIPRQRNNKN